MEVRFLKSTIWAGVCLWGTLSAVTVSAQPYAYVANVSGNSVSVVNTSTMSVAANIPLSGSPSGLAVTPNGSWIYVALQGANSVAVISTATNSLVTTIPVGTLPVELAISPNGALVYAVNRSAYTVSAISTASNSVIATIPVGSRPMAVAFNPSGSRAYVTNLYDNTVTIIDTAASAPLGTFSTASGPSGIAVLGNGTIYVANQNSSVVTVHDASGNLLNTISGLAYPNWVAATPDGSQVFVTNGNGGSVSAINTSTNALVATVKTGSLPTSVAVSADGAYAYVTNEYSFTLSQISVATATLVTSFRVGVYPLAVATPPASSGPPPACTYSLSANGVSFTAAGGSGSVNVIAPSGCAWTATSNIGWAQITSGTPGSGNGTVNYSVSSNGSSLGQSGTLTIAGQTYTITEGGIACTYTLSATSGSFSSSGGTGSVNVTAPSGCVWTAGSNVGWAGVTSGGSGIGNGTVNYSVGANSTANTLTGSLTIAGQNYGLTETGVACTFGLSSTSASFTSSGGTGTVNVTAPSGCTWTASSNVGWASITSGSPGNGNGTVGYSGNANLSNSPISGTLTIAGQTFTINESGTACTYSLTASSVNVGSGAGTGSVNINTGSACSWGATSDSSWLTITAGFSGTGNGTISYSYAANNSINSRTGNLTIGGQNYALNQAGASFTPIRVNCGGPQVTDSGGNVWSPDNAPNYNITNAAIANTTNQAIYQSESWSKGTLQYQYTVPNGSFTVKLHFAEFYMTQAGQRTFNIVVNGSTFYSSYDIFAAVGANTADDLSIPVVVSNGQITIQLVPVTGPAKVNAIEIF